MSDEIDPRGEAPRWLEQAVEELDTASHLAEDASLPGRIAAFWAHLAAEKALKASLIASGVAPRKSHDLQGFLDELPRPRAEQFRRDDLDLLNPWNLGSRYWDRPSSREPSSIEALLAAATRVVEAAGLIVREAGL